MAEKEHLLVPEIAEKLRIPSWKVVRWLESGRLEGGRAYGRWWATSESVEKVAKELNS